MTTKEKYLCQLQMDTLLTFLELPIDTNPYQLKSFECTKPPLRILITEAGSKAAYHLIYKICSGHVFGVDQPIILHLVNAKGTIDHKATLLDLNECGFSVLIDSVVSCEPKKTYGDVDIVVLMAMFEELEGHSLAESFLSQLGKARTVAKNMCEYSKPDSKLIVCSPSTKGVLVLLTFLKLFEPEKEFTNVTGVMVLDETLTKSHVAQQLKTTTDKIKNVVIWGATAPDLRNATVLMYPPDDKGNWKKVEVPVLEALSNHKWVYSDLVQSIYRRVMISELTTHGGAVASAAAKHLKLLFQGSDSQEEIASMGVIIPPGEPYGFTKNVAFSLPVFTSNGNVTIRQDVRYETVTHLMNIRSVHQIHNQRFTKSLFKVIKHINEYEEKSKKEFVWYQHSELLNRIYLEPLYFKYLITPRFKIENITDEEDEPIRSVTWKEKHPGSNEKKSKSVLRFNLSDK